MPTTYPNVHELLASDPIAAFQSGAVGDVYWANKAVQGASTGGAPAAPTAVETPTYDPQAAAAAAKAAADAAKAAKLRTEVTSIVNNIKDIFNSRYGQVDASAQEQTGKLQDRFTNESQDVARQVTDQNQQAGSAYAARGAFDSSYRGNAVDSITKGGESQVRDLGQELQDNLAKISSWIVSQKTNMDAQKGGVESIVSHLAEETDPGRLTEIRNTLDAKIAELRGSSADNNTAAQNAGALEAVAPSSQRAIQLKTTLGQILAGGADKSLKASIGQRLIQNAGLNPDEQQKLLLAFQGELAASDEQKQEQPTA